MQVEKVYEGNLLEIFRMSPSLYFRKSDVKTRHQCNNAYLVGDTCVGVVDVSTLEAAQEFLDETKLLFDKPLKHIFLTHGHGDHANGLPAFLDKDVTIYCSRRLFEKIDPIGNGYKATFVAVEGSMRMSISGGLEVELFTLPDVMHSPWDMFVRIPSEHALCTGDAVVEYRMPFFHSASVESWIASLKKLAKGDDEHIISGHGIIYPHSYIGEFAEFLETILRAANQCLKRLDCAVISAEKASEAVSSYFAEGGEDAKAILEKAGEADAKREVRMVLWYLIRAEMR